MKKNSLTKSDKDSKQGLQKFTDFEEVKTLEQFKELQETDPEKLTEIRIWLQDKVNDLINQEKRGNCYELDMYYDRLEKCIEAGEKSDIWLSLYKRDRWYINDTMIKNYIHRTLLTKKYLPNNTEISNETGLSRVTINKHIKGNSLSSFKEEERDKFRMLNSKALNQLYYLAFKNDDVKALKYIIELTKEPEGSGKVINNNFLQINNTKIDTVLIEKLPEETRRQIERLILENTPKELIQIKP